MEFNTLTTTLNNFLMAFSGGYALLLPSVRWLTGTLLVIELILIGLFWAISGGERLGAVIKKLLFILFWLMVISYFDVWSKAFRDSLIDAGLIAGGQAGNRGFLLDPSRIAGYGLDATMVLADRMRKIHAWQVLDAIILGLSYIMIMLAFLVIAIQVFITQIEFYLVMVLSSILLPWGLLKPTKFIAEKAIGSVVSASVKLMVLSFIIAVADGVLSNIAYTGTILNFNEIWSVLLTVGTIAFLAWSAPGMAAGMISGSPSLTAGTLAQNTAASVMAGSIAAQGMVSATRAASKGVGGVAAAGARGVGAYQAGSNMASAGGAGKLGAALGGVKTASASLVRSTVGKMANSVQEAGKRNVSRGMRAGYSASGGTLSEGMKGAQAKDEAAASGGHGRKGNWSNTIGKAMHATPHEARPSGGGSSPKL